LVGIERSGPTPCEFFKKGKNFSPKNFDPKKANFGFCFQKKQVPGAWLNAAWNSEPCVKKRHCLLLSGRVLLRRLDPRRDELNSVRRRPPAEPPSPWGGTTHRQAPPPPSANFVQEPKAI
jgi:hypothetical protein